MEINITGFFYTGQAHLYSASNAELGQDASKITWNNSMNYAGKYRVLETLEKRSAFREILVDTGGWTPSEVLSFTLLELNALFIQFISGYLREAGLDVPFPDWEQYQEDVEAGRVQGRIFKAEDNQVYFDLS